MLSRTLQPSSVSAGLRQRLSRMRRHPGMTLAEAGASGFLLSAAGLFGRPVPVSLGLLCAATAGAQAGAAALGSALGYLLFWREIQPLAWLAAGLTAFALTRRAQPIRHQELLMSAIAALIVSGCGLGWLLLFRDDTPVGIYLIRVGISFGTTACFRAWRSDPKGPAGALVCGLVTFSAGGIPPGPVWSQLAAGLMAVRLSLPMAVMAGFGLDLARITPVPMAGAICLGIFLGRLLPGPKWFGCLCPALGYAAVCLIYLQWDPAGIAALALGGLSAGALPDKPAQSAAAGPVSLAQVRLEGAAVSMDLLEQTLLTGREPEIDRGSLLARAAMDSCDTCPERKGCRARQKLPGMDTGILEQPGLALTDLPPGCRKPARLLAQLRLSQQQLRSIKADRTRQQAYRTALAEQYRTLSGYLRQLSDRLCAMRERPIPRFRPDIGICGRAAEEISGDQWASFSPGEDKCCFLLCDGMGTGEGAAQDARQALELLRQLLLAGFREEQALESFHTLSALRHRAGSATVDLVSIDLCTGRASLYKWGSGASYLLREGELKKIGTAGPPPGTSQQARFGEDRLSLGEEEVLILLSDGAGTEGFARPQWYCPEHSAGEMAAMLLEQSLHRGDDATVAVVRLIPLNPDIP